MTSQNEEAEELMRRIEKEEERLSYSEPDKQCFHLCIVNLVIGTLYCAKGNFEFGVSRIIKVYIYIYVYLMYAFINTSVIGIRSL